MKRLSLFAGHYGSGKTNIAINYALDLKKSVNEVYIADMDIVNPYFRTKDSEKELNEAGVKLISLKYANTNVDLPSLPQEIYGLVQRRDCHAVMDIGGDDRGAYALGRYAPYILEENNYDMFFVANFFRPLTRTAEEAYEVMREIENACGIPFTGIINNSNVGRETTAEDVESTFGIADDLSRLSSLPVVMTTVTEEVASGLECENKFILNLQNKIF
ncbi:MAG: hypothetical protein IJO24_09350 [Clostridia bacterium]|nr:hypothetical protein [Clostridia bacterium]